MFNPAFGYLDFLKKKILEIEESLEIIDMELHPVKEEYLEKDPGKCKYLFFYPFTKIYKDSVISDPLI